MDCSPANLMANARCIDQCIPDGLKLPALIALAVDIAGVSSNPDYLMNQARCISSCVPGGIRSGMVIPLLITLACDIANTTAPPCINLIPDGTNYSGGSAYLLTGLTTGATYSLEMGANEVEAINGTTPGCGAIISSTTFISCDGSLLLIGASGGIPVTATVCLVETEQIIVTSFSGGNGSISPDGTTVVEPGDSLNFTATPDPDYAVDQWLLDGSPIQDGGAGYTLTGIFSDHTVEVTFKLLQYQITGIADTGGTVTPSGTFLKDAGSSQVFTSTPGACYDTNQWKLDGVLVQSGGNTYTLSNIQASHTVEVSFVAVLKFTSVTPNTSSAGGGYGPEVYAGCAFLSLVKYGGNFGIRAYDGSTIFLQTFVGESLTINDDNHITDSGIGRGVFNSVPGVFVVYYTIDGGVNWISTPLTITVT